MTSPKSFRLVYKFSVLTVVLFGLALTAILLNPSKASADACSVNGRDCYYGYFTNVFDGGRGVLRFNVMSAPALLNVNNGADLVNTLWGAMGGCPGGGLWSQTDQNAVGAAFIIVSMLHGPAGAGLPKNTACSEFGTWSTMVYNLEASGYVNFNQIYNFGGLNSRSTKVDAAFYQNVGQAASIVFYDPNTGAPMYAIKKNCANPVGQIQALKLNYNLKPNIVATVNGNPVTGPVEAGDQVTFRYFVNNLGTTSSVGTVCNGGAINRAGYFPTPGTPEAGGVPLVLTCSPPNPPQTFPRGTNTLVGGPENITAASNTTYCRTLFVNPATTAGNTEGTELCVQVANKPYVKVFGGDVSAGGGLETAPNTCATNANAAIVAWNKGTAGGYSGAGAQYAAQTIAGITDFASAAGNAGGAPTPTGLSFANTSTNVGAGNFGGNAGSVKCIRDYYGERALLGALPNISTLAPGTGTYEGPTDTTLAGATLNPGDRWTIYINGDLRITGNITFSGAGWTSANMPFLKVVVRGNIYIAGGASGVTRLDGVYIAQANAGAGGTIYTCATGSPLAPPTLTNGAFYASCTNQLRVNGALVANSIEFDRTGGTLRASTANETSASTNISEMVNFGPAFWMMQPAAGNGKTDNYDSITSLPPVL